VSRESQVSGVWLVHSKKSKSGADSGELTYAEAVDELLCFGWIDSLPRALDTGRTMVYVCPRRPGSPLNKTRINKLGEQGMIAAAGRVKIEVAKADGSWQIYDDLEGTPPDLALALNKSPAALRASETLPPGRRRQLVLPLLLAKKPETRAGRVKKLVEQLDA
jgi:uncharacterized protein YdeI (YjbR/CyaY-like superfamily)